ncbi:hypothetical protein [Streptomyces sindenensis]|uniref:pPIWI-associating nuclease domain-containing protein n=1 Tax=Streptomyces sindenensis TaxID=67363 RepID=UPI0016751711|nr:hypothetical protein [Streptomyces sindenensis]GGP56200.1 hypothetical protein GCM10010231_29000 [Streptomyces sindenensis]
MDIDGSDAESGDEAKGEDQQSAEEKPRARRGTGAAFSSDVERILLGPGSLASSFAKAREFINVVHSAFDSAQGAWAQSGAAEAAARLDSGLQSAFRGQGDAAAAAAASMRLMDQLTPLDRAVSEFAVTSQLAEQMAVSSALTSWRSALEANSRIEARLRGLPVPSPLFSDLAQISRTQVDLTDWAVLRAPGRGLLSETSGMPVAAWRHLVADAVDDEDELPTVVATGRTNLSLLGTDLLTSTDADPGLIAEGADRVESEIVEPWMAARQKVVADLYVVLRRIDPKIPELLNGAWDDINRNGPAAAEKAANCAVEALDRALRHAAPDDAVRAWHAENGRSAKEWEGQDRPPRSLRVRYLFRDLAGPRDLVVSQVDAFAKTFGRLRGRLESVKHASQGDLVAVQALVINAETLLITLFLSTGFPDS